jgi:hypothetical protein
MSWFHFLSHAADCGLISYWRAKCQRRLSFTHKISKVTARDSAIFTSLRRPDSDSLLAGGQGQGPRSPCCASFLVWHATRRQPGERCFREMRARATRGLDTMGNLWAYLWMWTTSFTFCRLVLAPRCACHLMPHLAAPAAAAVSQTTSTLKSSEPAPAAACRQAGSRAAPVQLGVAVVLVLAYSGVGRQAAASVRACHHCGIIRCTYIDTFITV